MPPALSLASAWGQTLLFRTTAGQVDVIVVFVTTGHIISGDRPDCNSRLLSPDLNVAFPFVHHLKMCRWLQNSLMSVAKLKYPFVESTSTGGHLDSTFIIGKKMRSEIETFPPYLGCKKWQWGVHVFSCHSWAVGSNQRNQRSGLGRAIPMHAQGPG